MTVDTSRMTAEQIENVRVEKQKELQKEQDAYHVVNQAKMELEKKRIDIAGMIKDLQISLSKSRQNIDVLKTDISILESEFWSKRR